MGKFCSTLVLFLSLIGLQSCMSTEQLSGKKANWGEIEKAKQSSQFLIEDEESFTVLDIDESVDQDIFIEDYSNENASALQKDHSLSADQLSEYQAKKGDTLMLIAFSIYGDIKRWREIYALNEELIGSANGFYDLSHRPILRYRKPLTPYIPPSGNPYLIKGGDSLSLISKKVYGNWREWLTIYQNNPSQISNPDLIFAGFTLYYPALKKPVRQLY